MSGWRHADPGLSTDGRSVPMDASQDGRTGKRWRTAELAMELVGELEYCAGLLDKPAHPGTESAKGGRRQLGLEASICTIVTVHRVAWMRP